VRIWLALIILLMAPASAQNQSVSVLSIGDGDTLRVRQGTRTLNVRLACIDAPETGQRPHGASARSQLQALAPLGSTVELRIQTIDHYGRSVAELSRQGRNLNQALVASGAAFVYWRYISGCDRHTYSRLETEARLNGLGVWSVPSGVTRPWDFRAGTSKPRSSESSPAHRRSTGMERGKPASD